MSDKSITVEKVSDEDLYEEETIDNEKAENEGVGYDFGKMTKVMETYDISINRGKFTANDVSFKVRPVTVEEFDSYMPMLNETIAFIKESESVDLRKMLTAKFSLKATKRTSNFLIIIINHICSTFFKNYIHYKRFKHGYIIAKWFEKLVTVNGKKVRFYDLERKYYLNKNEIIKLLNYINELSGFSDFFD